MIAKRVDVVLSGDGNGMLDGRGDGDVEDDNDDDGDGDADVDAVADADLGNYLIMSDAQ